MNETGPEPCGRFLNYVNDPAHCPPHEILSHVESCPSCLAEMISHQEAGRDLFMEAKYDRELALARKLYQRQIRLEEGASSSANPLSSL